MMDEVPLRMIAQGTIEQILECDAFPAPRRNAAGEITAMGMGSATNLIILTERGTREIKYTGQLPEEVRGHQVRIYDVPLSTYTIKRSSNDSARDYPQETPRKIKIFDMNTGEWYL